MRVPTIPKNGPRPATVATSSNRSTVSPRNTSNGSLPSSDQCMKCQLIHLASRKCPPLASESQIRIALDDVKGLSGGDPDAIQRNRALLQSILKENKVVKLGANRTQHPQPQQAVQISQSVQQQISRQPTHQLAQQLAQQPIQHIPQQPVQQSVQQQAQLSAPMGSLEWESGSESESETASESGSGSSGSKSGEDVLREILSR